MLAVPAATTEPQEHYLQLCLGFRHPFEAVSSTDGVARTVAG